MKRIAETEREPIVELDAVVGVDPIAVQPQLAVVIPFDFEHVRVAVQVRNYVKCRPYHHPSNTPK